MLWISEAIIFCCRRCFSKARRYSSPLRLSRRSRPGLSRILDIRSFSLPRWPTLFPIKYSNTSAIGAITPSSVANNVATSISRSKLHTNLSEIHNSNPKPKIFIKARLSRCGCCCLFCMSGLCGWFALRLWNCSTFRRLRMTGPLLSRWSCKIQWTTLPVKVQSSSAFGTSNNFKVVTLSYVNNVFVLRGVAVVPGLVYFGSVLSALASLIYGVVLFQYPSSRLNVGWWVLTQG